VTGWLRYFGCTDWIIDTWTRVCAWNGIDLIDNNGVARLTAVIDEIKAEAGVGSLAVTSHMPHAAKTDRAFERSLGAQAFSGWVDVMWRYVRDESGMRYLSADGRKVGLNECRVVIGPDGRLVGQAGDREGASAQELDIAVCAYVADNPGQSQNKIEIALKHLGRNKVRQALHRKIQDGAIITKDGARDSVLHYPGSAWTGWMPSR
jgi:hypothetical protein